MSSQTMLNATPSFASGSRRLIRIFGRFVFHQLSVRSSTHFLQVLFEPGYVIEPACNSKATALREAGREFYDAKYQTQFDNIFTTIGNWFKAMGDDPLNTRFGEDWARLTKDLLFDSEGSLKFKAHLWNDIRKVILPALVDKVCFVFFALLLLRG
jgi:Family of unknown function (DUF5923)